MISARDLRKVYRLYRKPAHRFLDMFGMLRGGASAYTEHAALDGVSLEIARGEKVAVIGRNGAGKSTFLKLVTGVIEPTSGTLEVRGKTHALLQIGTGFHPDFTGRQNVYAYLAQLGVSGGEADQLCKGIVEFSELEEYIDQPVKTYSTGMGVRLMFSTSTAISPDLLVLDEVLGVGDAYFAHKSFERMRELCDREGTSLLLVTHDVYSAIRLCPRAVWIDRGRVLMDGEGPAVVRAYEDSIRQQEEHRLRVRKQARVRELSRGTTVETSTVLVEVRARDNQPQSSTVYFRDIGLRVGDGELTWLPLGESAFAEAQGSHLQQEATAWGDAVEVDGAPARPFLNFGTPFHRVVGVFVVAIAPEALLDRTVDLQLTYRSERACELFVHLFSGAVAVELGELPPSTGTWVTHRFHETSLRSKLATRRLEAHAARRHGSGAISLTDVQSVAPDGSSSHVFSHGSPFELRLEYRINDPGLQERAQVIVVFHRNGVEDVLRVITRELLFDAARPQGTVSLRMPRLPLGAGAYTVTALVAQEGYYDRDQALFYSINPGVYTSLSKVLEILVEGGGVVASGTAVVGDGVWSMSPEPWS